MPFSNQLWNDLSGGQPANELSGAFQELSDLYGVILGNLMVFQLHSQLGIGYGTPNVDVDTWTDRVGGRVIPAPDASSRPLYQPYGSSFGGKRIVWTDKALGLVLRAVAVTPIALNGTRPWLYLRAALRTAVSASADTLMGVGSTTDNATIQNLAPSQLRVFWDGAVSLNGPTADTLVHDWQVYKDGVNKNFVVDNTVFSAADAGTITADITRFAVGTSASVNSNKADAAVALVIGCSSKPTDTQIAAIRAVAAAEFPP